MAGRHSKKNLNHCRGRKMASGKGDRMMARWYLRKALKPLLGMLDSIKPVVLIIIWIMAMVLIISHWSFWDVTTDISKTKGSCHDSFGDHKHGLPAHTSFVEKKSMTAPVIYKGGSIIHYFPNCSEAPRDLVPTQPNKPVRLNQICPACKDLKIFHAETTSSEFFGY